MKILRTRIISNIDYENTSTGNGCEIIASFGANSSKNVDP